MNTNNKTFGQMAVRELENSLLNNPMFLEQMFLLLQEHPEQVSSEWRQALTLLSQPEEEPATTGSSVANNETTVGATTQQPTTEHLLKQQLAVMQLISAYRTSGVEAALLNPLEPDQLPVPELTPQYYGLSAEDLAQPFMFDSPAMPAGSTIGHVVAKLRKIYCGTIGVEFMHSDERLWLQQRLEQPAVTFAPDTKRRILELLTGAETLERFLQKKYVGQKRFSLEGGETLIPLLDHLIQTAGSQGVREMVIGMAHRGRLNVLVNIMGKPARDLFLEFEGHASEPAGATAGDVKYHKGYSSHVDTAGGAVHLSLACNPSHLEIVGPVVQGSVRARQQRRHDAQRNQVIPVLIHGDASFSGQGVVMETLNMSQARGFTTGGSVHVIINNQIGFTVSDPRDSRSTRYCSDLAKMIAAPIFHVNGDDAEAALRVVEIALAYRMRFHKDVVIDLVCFRKLGHNEADEPAVTQPAMYKAVNQHPGTRKLYADRLIAEGVVSSDYPDFSLAEYEKALVAGRSVAGRFLKASIPTDPPNWSRFLNSKLDTTVNTAYPLADLKRLSAVLTSCPSDFQLHAVVEKLLAQRAKMAEGSAPVDWGMGETLAYATVLEEGYAVRLCGQDSGRGTFAHRHAVLHNQSPEHGKETTYIPLAHVAGEKTGFEVVDSLLSEEAALAFEYGYSTAAPDALAIWEAQFGDFANGAQVVIDQFISSGEAKWGRLSGLVMLLPHSYEGQGAEHSSARLERFLQLCAQENMQVCLPTTPAQIFHLLRRQVHMSCRKPLIVLTPKSLLRHKEAVSTMRELAYGSFEKVLADPEAIEAEKVRRLILCSGKVYYDLVAARRQRNLNTVAIVRIEQLYPFPKENVAAALRHYRNAREVVWVQEEPINQGAWSYIQQHLLALAVNPKLLGLGRPESAAPAVGHMPEHLEQQKTLVEVALS